MQLIGLLRERGIPANLATMPDTASRAGLLWPNSAISCWAGFSMFFYLFHLILH